MMAGVLLYYFATGALGWEMKKLSYKMAAYFLFSAPFNISAMSDRCLLA
jgi:hypothetical protein